MTANNLNLMLLLDHLSEAIAERVSDKIKTPSQATIPTNPEEEYLDTNQALEFIKVKSRVTLDTYVKEGRIDKPKMRGGRKLYYKKSNLINFLNHG
jgi:hypothetical protein